MTATRANLRARILDLYNRGFTKTSELAELLHVHRRTIIAHRKVLGISEPSSLLQIDVIEKHVRELGYVDLDAAVLANATMPVRQLAQVLHTSTTTIIRRRAKLGVTAIKKKRYEVDWSMPLEAYPGRLKLNPDEHWCPLCGDNTVDLEEHVCMCCGNQRLLDAKMFLREGEYEYAGI